MQLISWSTFKSGLFGFTGDLFASHPTYGNQTGPKIDPCFSFPDEGIIDSPPFNPGRIKVVCQWLHKVNE
jgi:hypothetical protein